MVTLQQDSGELSRAAAGNYQVHRSSSAPASLTQVEAGDFSLFGLARVTLFHVKWGTGVLRQWVLIYV